MTFALSFAIVFGVLCACANSNFMPHGMIALSKAQRKTSWRKLVTITIHDISFNRVFLEVKYTTSDNSSNEHLKLYRYNSQLFVNFEEEQQADGSVFARTNLTIAEGREPLCAGDWMFCVKVPESEQSCAWASKNKPYRVSLAKKRLWNRLPKQEKEELGAQGVTFNDYPFTEGDIDAILREHPYDTHLIAYAPDLLERLEDLSHVYRYVKGKYAYAVYLCPRTDALGELFVVVMPEFYIRNENPRVRKNSKRFTEKRIFAWFYRLVHSLTKRKGNRVLFFKVNGENPTDNMAAIRDRMRERGLDESFVIAERYRNTFDGKQRVANWLKDIVEIAKSDFIFIDDYCPVFNFVEPYDDMTLTQVWHAGVGFKSVGYARFGMPGSPDPYESAHRRYTWALVGNEHLRDIYSEVFGIEKQALLATGMPRLDGFLNPERTESAQAELTERYPWMNEGRVIVFAPTFRGTGQRSAHYPYDKFIDYEALYNMCERTNSYFVFEMHHFIKKDPCIPEEFEARLIDLSEENLNKLYFVADVLVTDYSSCFYDFLLLEKPVVFYVPDKTIYQVTRGVQRTVDEMAPGVVCDTFERFVEVLETEEYAHAEFDATVIDRCLEGSGLATDRVIDTILLGKDVPGVKM